MHYVDGKCFGVAIFLLLLFPARALAEGRESPVPIKSATHVEAPVPGPPIANPAQLKAEAFLEAIEFGAEDIRLRSLPSHDGCSCVIKVQRRVGSGKEARWENIAAMKTRSGFTYPQAEVGYYRMGKYLGFNIFAVTVSRNLKRAGIKMLLADLENRDFGHACKEPARQKLVLRLKKDLERRHPTHRVALKEWLPSFQHFPSDGFHRLPEVFRCGEHLTRAGEQPSQDVVEFENSRRGKKATRYVAEASIRDMVVDISNLMVLDAVASQYDRWGGHNLHFRLEPGEEYRETEEGVLRGGRGRILALDNGSAMRGKTVRSLKNLKRRVHRYDKRFVHRLRELQRWVKEDPQGAREWLGLPSFEFRNLRHNLKTVLQYIEEQTSDNPEAWFEGQSPE
jgi:hypothetical protein